MDDTHEFDETDESLPTIDKDTLDDLLQTKRSLTPPPESDNNVVAAPTERQQTPNTETATTHSTPDFEETRIQFQRAAIGLQRDLLREVHGAVESVGGTLQAILGSMNSESVNIGQEQATNNPTPGLAQSLANISSILNRRHEQMPPQSGSRDVAQNLLNIYDILRDIQQHSYMATMSAFHSELLTVIKNQQLMLNALKANFLTPDYVVPHTSSATAVGITTPTHPAANEPTEGQSESTDEDDFPATQFQRKTGH